MYSVIEQALRNRHFEYNAAKNLDLGNVRPPIYLSVGTEFIPPLLMMVLKEHNINKFNIFTQHRCHSYFLTLSKDYKGLKLELCASDNGCNAGYAGSASLSYTKDTNQKMWGHSGLLGDQIPIACGAAHASQEFTICVLGDAAAEEDYALGAFGYAVTKSSPILFLCEDNNLSLLTTKAERRSWDIAEVVKSMGITTYKSQLKTSIKSIYYILSRAVEDVQKCKPAFINIEVYRHLWHAGSGQDGPVQYDWLNAFKNEFRGIEIDSIEQEAKQEMDKIWQPEK